jgi:CubicO group peptidase (beta-lactamase class C family)
MVLIIFSLIMTGAAVEPKIEEKKLIHFIDQLVSQEMTCTSLAIGVKKNEVRVERFSGGTSASGSLNSDTVFKIGSITKTFTATLLAIENQKGRIHLNDLLSSHTPFSTKIPSYNNQQIRILHLADHTSALPRDMPTPDPRTLPSAVWRFLGDYHLTQPPGVHYSYSNLGFGILGLILERTKSQTLDTLFTRFIARPLGMGDTTINLSPAQRARLVGGYRANGQLAPEAEPGFPALDGSGALHSTLKDMMRYMEFELGEINTPLNVLLSDLHQVRHAMGSGRHVGLGWMMQTLANGSRVIRKNGAMSGYSAFIAFVPSSKTGAVILANQASCPVEKLGRQVISALNNLAFDLPKLALAEEHDH